MYFLLGISLTLAFLLLVNMAVAICSLLVWKLVSDRVEKLPVAWRAKMIFGLRVVPVVAALTFVLAFVVPAYVLHEPESSGEVVSAKLALLAGLCLLGVIIAFFRVFQTYLATRRLSQNWLRNSSEIKVEGVDLPVLKIDHTFPVLAVVGTFRPRIFVAAKVLDALTPDEFRAAIAHEFGHLRGQDNLKRTVLRVCRDLLILPIGGGLDIAWAQTAEVVADEYATVNCGARTLDLADALIKIARIVPDGATPSLPVGAYILSDRGGDISARIRRLLSRSDLPIRTSSVASNRYYFTRYAWSFLIPLVLAVHFFDQRLLMTTHNAIEHFVRIIR
ncbi:MAG: M56 family metallopeptidase [Pyrinomonadaceae bacterium]